MSSYEFADFIFIAVESFVEEPSSEIRQKIFDLIVESNPYTFFQSRNLEELKVKLEKDNDLHMFLLTLTNRVFLTPVITGENKRLLSASAVSEEALKVVEELYQAPNGFVVNEVFQRRTEFNEKYVEAIKNNLWLVTLYVLCVQARYVAHMLNQKQTPKGLKK